MFKIQHNEQSQYDIRRNITHILFEFSHQWHDTYVHQNPSGTANSISAVGYIYSVIRKYRSNVISCIVINMVRNLDDKNNSNSDKNWISLLF